MSTRTRAVTALQQGPGWAAVNVAVNTPGTRAVTSGMGTRSVIAVLMMLVGAGVAGCAGATPAANTVDRTDAAATAQAFVQRYAVHDPAACELASARLRPRLDADGRCGGAAHGGAPLTDVLNAQTCGNKALFSAAVTPAGEIGKPYVSIGLDRDPGGAQWSVDAVLPLTDRSVIKPYPCATHTQYTG